MDAWRMDGGGKGEKGGWNGMSFCYNLVFCLLFFAKDSGGELGKANVGRERE